MTEQEKQKMIEDYIHIEASGNVISRFARQSILKLKDLNDTDFAALENQTTEDKILDTLLRIEQLLIKQMAIKEIKSNG